MRVLLAFDKFKHALTARQAGETVQRVLEARHPGWHFDLCPLTDGGEGFCETLTRAAGGRMEQAKVTGPRGQTVEAPLGLVVASRLAPPLRARLEIGDDQILGVIGMAEASGLALLAPEERDPWQATTLGTGELMRAAIGRGAASLLLGIGGSATNDLGLGALDALGFVFQADDGTRLHPPVPASWPRLARIDGGAPNPLPPIGIACDVTNPLLGPQGATAIYGPQKGLSKDGVERLEAQMARVAEMLCSHFGRARSLKEQPGSGAAGGIGFGLMAAAGARLLPGFELVTAWLDLPRRIAAADIVITGEGRFDATSLSGKGPGSIAEEARRLGKGVHIFAGSLGVQVEGACAITPAGMPLADALPRTAELLAAAVEREFRL